MRILILIFLLSACSNLHPANVKDGTKAQQPVTQQPVTQQPSAQQSATHHPAVQQPRKRPASQDQAAPAKVQGNSIEAD